MRQVYRVGATFDNKKNNLAIAGLKSPAADIGRFWGGPRMRKLLLIVLAVLAASGAVAKAETFPSRPISIVVTSPAGGPTDTLGRILADRMKRALGQSVIVETLTGAAGTIGVGHVARSAPDGYTLSLRERAT